MYFWRYRISVRVVWKDDRERHGNGGLGHRQSSVSWRLSRRKWRGCLRQWSVRWGPGRRYRWDRWMDRLFHQKTAQLLHDQPCQCLVASHSQVHPVCGKLRPRMPPNSIRSTPSWRLHSSATQLFMALIVLLTGLRGSRSYRCGKMATSNLELERGEPNPLPVGPSNVRILHYFVFKWSDYLYVAHNS